MKKILLAVMVMFAQCTINNTTFAYTSVAEAVQQTNRKDARFIDIEQVTAEAYAPYIYPFRHPSSPVNTYFAGTEGRLRKDLENIASDVLAAEKDLEEDKSPLKKHHNQDFRRWLENRLSENQSAKKEKRKELEAHMLIKDFYNLMVLIKDGMSYARTNIFKKYKDEVARISALSTDILGSVKLTKAPPFQKPDPSAETKNIAELEGIISNHNAFYYLLTQYLIDKKGKGISLSDEIDTVKNAIDQENEALRKTMQEFSPRSFALFNTINDSVFRYVAKYIEEYDGTRNRIEPILKYLPEDAFKHGTFKHGVTWQKAPSTGKKIQLNSLAHLMEELQKQPGHQVHLRFK